MDEAKVKQLVEEFQCPGCVCGMDITCGAFQLATDHNAIECIGHVIGTHLMGVGSIAIGLPKGFCRPGNHRVSGEWKHRNQMNIRLWPEGTHPNWDRFNVPVWAMVKDGYLFVRTYAPRINSTWTDVVEGGTLELVPGADDVGQFYDEID